MERWWRWQTSRRALLGAGCLVLCLVSGAAWSADSASAVALRARFAELSRQARLAPQSDPFGLPIHLQSRETSDHVEGEVYARIDHPFDVVRHALEDSSHWCDILILHLNVKYCRAVRTPSGEVLQVGLGRKYHQPLTDVHWVRFDFRQISTASDGVQVVLQAPSGPMSTHDYRMTVEAAPLAAGATVLRLSYGYSYGVVGRLAMQSYLSSLGRDKVGFSVTGRRTDGQPVLVDGVRGVVERNVIRYYLAIGAYLDTRTPDGQRQLHKSLLQWFNATERFPLQLHEVERSEYLDMKVREVRRQETVVVPLGTG